MSDAATIDDVVTAIRAKMSPVRGPVIVGIDGPSGAGKSTLAKSITAAFGDHVAEIEGDDFYADIDWALSANFDPVEAYARHFDWQRLHVQILRPARSGDSSLRYQRYDWDNKRIGEWAEIPTPAILVVEGVYMLRPELRDALDLGIWVDAGRDLRIARQHARHATYEPEIANRQNAMIELWEAAWLHYDARYDPRAVADILISGETDEPA